MPAPCPSAAHSPAPLYAQCAGTCWPTYVHAWTDTMTIRCTHYNTELWSNPQLTGILASDFCLCVLSSLSRALSWLITSALSCSSTTITMHLHTCTCTSVHTYMYNTIVHAHAWMAKHLLAPAWLWRVHAYVSTKPSLVAPAVPLMNAARLNIYMYVM